MLSLIGFAMVVTFMILIMSGRLSALIALILVPTLFALAAGFHAGLGAMMIDGVRELAPTGVMLLFAILYFGLMIDAGLFDPLVARIVTAVHGDPLRIVLGTAALGLSVSLDGDGTTSYMICTAAMLPLYRHMKMDMRVLACVLILCSGAMNILPWGGPTARVASVLQLDPQALYVSMIPAQLATIAWVLFAAWRLGLRERRRLAALLPGSIDEDVTAAEVIAEQASVSEASRRPRLRWINLALTVALLILLVAGALPLPILFMLAFAIAAMINYPTLGEQKERIAAHAGNALAVVSLIFAAGIFTGILSGTKMVDAMADTVIAAIPPALGGHMAPVTALLSMPFTVLISNDAFYFGMLPILAKTAEQYGIGPMEIAHAALVGQQIHLLSPLVASTYLLVGMCGIELGQHQRFTFLWAIGACLVFLLAGCLTGMIPI